MTDKLRMYKNKKYICFLGDKDVDSHRSCICYMLGAPFDFSAFARLWCYSSPTWWSTEICKNSFHSYGIHEQVSAFMTCFVSFAKKGVSTRNKSYLNNSTKDSKHTCKFFIMSTEFDKNISDWKYDCTDYKNDFDFLLRLVKWPKIAVKKNQNFQKF